MQSQTVYNFTRQLHILLNNILQPPQKKLKKFEKYIIILQYIGNRRKVFLTSVWW